MIIAVTLAAAAAGLPQPIRRMAAPLDAALAAQLFERPAGVGPDRFVTQLAEASSAAGWQRFTKDDESGGIRIRMTGLRGPGGEVLVFFAPADDGEAEAGRVCRLSRAAARLPTEEELERASNFCIAQVGGRATVRIQPPAAPARQR